MQLRDLDRQSRKAIKGAGPRYSPGIDPTAPNLSIAHLTETFDALALAPEFRTRTGELWSQIQKAWKKAPNRLRRLFAGSTYSPECLVDALQQLKNSPPRTAGRVLGVAQEHAKRITRRLQARMSRLRDLEMAAHEDSEERQHLNIELYQTREVYEAIKLAIDFCSTAAAASLSNNILLVVGQWGTGKTHSLCDLASRRIRQRLPTLLVLAHQLPPRVDPFQGICDITSLASTSARLLAELQRLGIEQRTRALLIVDAINEGDRRAWRKTLPRLRRVLPRYPNVGVILSCRHPFEQHIASHRTLRQVVRVDHKGFTEIEFDAQLSFFDYYNIPAPQFPLITPEFSRPLFLQLLCKALNKLSVLKKHRQLRDFASGQRGMTYLLEFFATRIGQEIEASHGLPQNTCWRILKGDRVQRSGSMEGIAFRMADSSKEYLKRAECIDAIRPFIPGGGTVAQAKAVLHDMLVNGLLTETLRWDNGLRSEVISFAYQRFSDHLIARYLLARHLVTSSATTIRRSFYCNRPLGTVFDLKPGAWSFKMPGIASAIMLEFPERVKGYVPDDQRELISYLPKRQRLRFPFRSVFLEGMYWRSSDSFTSKTSDLVAALLRDCHEGTRYDTLDVLVSLATRPGHPYSADRLYSYLEQMSMADRDLLWTEYVRHTDGVSTISKLLEWVERSVESGINVDTARAAITLLSLCLTSTRHPLRDRVTRALAFLGTRFPSELFAHTDRTLAFNDPYVPERMLAACYGIAMWSWADPSSTNVQVDLVSFARRLAERMFLPGAPCPTNHILMRDYTLGIIALGCRIEPLAIPKRWRRYLRIPMHHVPSPILTGDVLTDRQKAEVEPALHMDFSNYTLGYLVQDRSNYDFNHNEYRELKARLLLRMYRLGYANSRFRNIDSILGNITWRTQNEGSKTDRYGKKYSWIAYFELFAIQQDAGRLPEWKLEHRTSDCDIDPSFPEMDSVWRPPLPDPFRGAPADLAQWLHIRRRPRYEHLLERPSINGLRGPWVLLEGFIEQCADEDPRRVFTFLRGLMLRPHLVESLHRALEQTQYPGNHKIPEASDDYFTFAGEIPWANQFGADLRDAKGRARRNLQKAFNRDMREHGIEVEVPVHRFSWESYHSELNQAGSVTVPAPSLCEALDLRNRGRHFDLFDARGRRASLYVRWDDNNKASGHLLYLRKSLVRRYLRTTAQAMAWIVWGERNLSSTSGLHHDPQLSQIWQSYSHIHKKMFRPR